MSFAGRKIWVSREKIPDSIDFQLASAAAHDGREQRARLVKVTKYQPWEAMFHENFWQKNDALPDELKRRAGSVPAKVFIK